MTNPSSTSSKPDPRTVECIIPILCVRDLRASIEFYRTKLGFTVSFNAGDFAGIARDGRALYLAQGSQGQPGTWIWIGIEDVDAVHRDLVAQGVGIKQPPTDQPWAREMHILDPDGNVLRLGSEPR
jgi:predicted enzyme related to lactoylglutathione lyase